MVAGETPPVEGARWIWFEASDRVQEQGDLRVFIGLASAWDDYFEGRPAIEQHIVEAAAELLQRPAPRRWLQLRAEQGASPLRRWRPARVVPVDAAALPVSAPLVEDLARWASDYDRTSNGFDSQRDAVEFVERGQRLVTRLQSELGDAWHLEYEPEPTQPPGLRLRPRQPWQLLGDPTS